MIHNIGKPPHFYGNNFDY
jgi:hypothetical protein